MRMSSLRLAVLAGARGAVPMTPELEPSGLGHDLLLAWAPWARNEGDGQASWSVRPRIEKGYDGDPPDDFWIVEKILAPQKVLGSVYWKMAAHWYLGEKTFAQITLDLGPNWPEKRIRLNLVCLCELVAREYLDFREVERKLRPRRTGPHSPVKFVA